MICPVTKSVLSDARKTIIAAMSSGVPRRLAGTPAAKAAFFSALPAKRFSNSVSTDPGINDHDK
jgi:hypothetical protein